MGAITKTEPLQPEGASSKLKLLNGVRVLVVDDNEDTRELVGIIMEQHGASVTLVGSAAQALEALNEGLHDVLICDIGMPDEDGYLFIIRLRARPPERGGRIPAIALTAFSEPDDRTRILQSGFQIYFSKPVEPSDLVTAVSRLSNRLSENPYPKS
jgi:CheY-like chemotaxis protein